MRFCIEHHKKFARRSGKAALLLAAGLLVAACGNKGEVEKPATAQTTNAVPGTGAGHSETGATGGAASGGTAGGSSAMGGAVGSSTGSSTGSAAGAVPGTSAGGEGRAATEGSAPTPAR